MTKLLVRATYVAVSIGLLGFVHLHGQRPSPVLTDSLPSGTSPAITLDEAISLAQRVQPIVVRALSGVNTAEHQERSAAVGAWLPSINATSSGASTWNEGVARIDPNTGLPLAANTVSRTAGFGFTGSWDVFTGFSRSAESRQAKANLKAADADLIDSRYQVTLQTKQQFYAALSAGELLQVRLAGVRRAEEQLNISVNKLRTGSATRSDSLRSVVTLGNAQVQLLNAATILATAEANLGRLVGFDGRVGAVDDPSFHDIDITVSESSLRQEAMASSPTVLSSDASAEAAQQSWNAAKGSWWPNMTLSGSWNWNGNNQVNNFKLLEQKSLRLNLTWPIFNGFNRETNIAVQANNYDIAAATADDTRRQTSAALITRVAELNAARLRVDIARVSIAAAEEDLRVQQERYRLGATTIIEVLASQEALNQAEGDEVEAHFDLLLAKAQIEALIGRPL
ncbi:MAG: TolC family protein [Gemmatimonadales bacterium]